MKRILFAGLLAVGRFKVLEGFMKAMMVLLATSTVLAVLLFLPQVDPARLPLLPLLPDTLDKATLVFLVGLVGWMPTALDIAVWQSLWAVEKARTEGRPLTARGSFFDFNVGYVGTAVLALAFVFLGAATLYGTDTAIPTSGVAFAALLIDVYAAALGDWTRPIILVAALSTMISTTLTVADGFHRALEGVVDELRHPDGASHERTPVYWAAYVLVSAGALAIIYTLMSQFTTLVDLATTLTCVTAPGFAVLNLMVLRSRDLPDGARPSAAYQGFHVAGIAFLTLFAGIFFYARFVV